MTVTTRKKSVPDFWGAGTKGIAVLALFLFCSLPETAHPGTAKEPSSPAPDSLSGQGRGAPLSRILSQTVNISPSFGIGVPGRFKSPDGFLQDPSVTPLGSSLAGSAYHRTRVQPPLPPTLLPQLNRDVTGASKGRLQIGIARAFSQPVVVDRTSTPASEWTLMPNGWRIWTLEITSQGALGVRVHLESVNLPPGVRLLIYDAAMPPPEVTPITSKALRTERDVWAHTVFAERVMLECQVPPGLDPANIAFKVTGISHLYRSPTPKAVATAGTCNNDVACSPDWAREAAGTARMMFVENGNTYLCSGCLLNVNSPAQPANYFLTANHCIGDQSAASTLELYWFYQAPSCNGTAPSLSAVPHTTGGADYLAGSAANDFGFMRLRNPPPAGVYYPGWAVSQPSSSETLTSIHHPDGESKKISFGKQTGTDGSFWSIQWSSGVTEPGSSGGPLFNSNHQLIGQLYGGLSSCGTPNGLDIFGRFDLTYNAIKQWIDPSASGIPPSGSPSVPPQAPVLSAKGIFAGLLQDPNGVSQQSSGLLTLTTAAKGKFTAKIQLGGLSYPVAGQFDSTGAAQPTIKRRNLTPLTLALQIDPSDIDHITGTISDGNWQANFDGNRAVFDGRATIAPQAGQYTLAVAGESDSTAQPGGAGFGTVSINKAGRIRFAATLADGTKVTQSTSVSKAGQWPLYVSLYGGQGVLLSSVSFTDNPTQDLSGEANWLKSAASKTKNYTSGFAIRTAISGSLYTKPQTGTSVLGTPGADLALSGGNLAQNVTSQITFGPNNRVTSLSGNKLRLSFAPSTGLFRGSVSDPASSKPITFNGVVLQKANLGLGSFLNANQSGQVVIQGTQFTTLQATTTRN